jgi:predicted amidohydrolase
VRPNDQPTGRKLFNSAEIIRNQTLLGFADKTLLPEYDVFDDPRYFEPGLEHHLFNIDETKVGVAICEDFWNDKTFWRQRLYQNDPAQELIELHPGLLISINASPFNKGKMAVRCEMVSHRARSAKLPIIFVNLIGGNDGVIFDGAASSPTLPENHHAGPAVRRIRRHGRLDCGIPIRAACRATTLKQFGPRWSWNSRLCAQEQFHQGRARVVRRN